MIVRIDMGSDFSAAQSELAHTPRQFLRGKIDILQWNRAKTDESIGVGAHNFRNVIVQDPAELQCIARFGPVTEHHRHGREDLHGNLFAIHFFDPPFWIPNVVCDFAKDAVADHHAGTARFVVIEPDESGIAVFGVKIGPIPRKNMGVEVDFHAQLIALT